jgi:high-affinity nickel-transport protein
VVDLSLVVLLLGMAALGFRHGFDWDHIAAITDITSTTSASHTEANVPAGAPMPSHGHEPDELRGHEHQHSLQGPGAMHALAESRFAHEERHAVGLATLYALGHAFVVLVLGIAALLLGAILPSWVDPILEKVVGLTLVLLGVWVLFSVYQYARGKGEFRLRSRWMLVFDFVRYGWGALQARIHGHEHTPSVHATQYGPKTAFGVGMIHGVGAETGSQALLLAGIAGVTGVTGIVILLAFVTGLLCSNTLVAVVSASGFLGAQRLRSVYLVVGFVAGLGSLVIGILFISGLGTALPDLQQVLFGGRTE